MLDYLYKSYDFEDSSLISVIDELPLWSAPFGIKLLESITYRKNIQVLDIGFGLGFPLLELAMRLGNSCKIYGIDPWKTAHERVRLKMTHYGISNVELIDGMAENIPLPDESIDLLVSNNGTNNVQDLRKTLSECYRVARNSAQFVITVNLPDTMIEFYTIFEKVLIECGFSNLLPAVKSHISSKRLPMDTLKAMLEQSGFIVTIANESEFSFTYNDAQSLFSHFLISMAFFDSWKNIIPENSREEIFKKIETYIDEVATRNSGFKLTIPFVTLNCMKLALP